MRRFHHRYADTLYLIVGVRGESGVAVNSVICNAHRCTGEHLDLGQMVGEELGGYGLTYAQHQQVVDVTDDFASFSPVTDFASISLMVGV